MEIEENSALCDTAYGKREWTTFPYRYITRLRHGKTSQQLRGKSIGKSEWV